MYKSARKTPYDNIVTNKRSAYTNAENKQQAKTKFINDRDALHEEDGMFDNINYGVRVYFGIEKTMWPDNINMNLPNNIKPVKLTV